MYHLHLTWLFLQTWLASLREPRHQFRSWGSGEALRPQQRGLFGHALRDRSPRDEKNYDGGGNSYGKIDAGLLPVPPPHSPRPQAGGYSKGRKVKILILTSGKLGDLVCMTSLYHAINAQLGAHVDIVSNRFGPVLYAGNPVVGKVFTLGAVSPAMLAKELYSHAVILNPNPELVALAVQAGIPNRISITTPRENFWTRAFERFLQERYCYRFDQQAVEFYQTMLGSPGFKPEPERRELFPSAVDQQRAKTFWQERGISGKFVVGMCLGAGKAYKLWPVERFAAVADYLVEKFNAKILLVGSAADQAYSYELADHMRHKDAIVDATGQFKLLEQAAVLQSCRLFVSVDTGPLYIADAMGVSVVDIAGPADCVTQHPIGKYKILYPPDKEQYGEMAKSFHSGSENEARYKRMIDAISVEQVTTAVDQLIGKVVSGKL